MIRIFLESILYFGRYRHHPDGSLTHLPHYGLPITSVVTSSSSCLVLGRNHVGNEELPKFYGVHVGLLVEDLSQVIVILFTCHSNVQQGCAC